MLLVTDPMQRRTVIVVVVVAEAVFVVVVELPEVVVVVVEPQVDGEGAMEKDVDQDVRVLDADDREDGVEEPSGQED